MNMEKVAKKRDTGYGPRGSHRNRPKLVSCHVSLEELALLQTAAERDYLNLPQWIRRTLLLRAKGEQ